MEEHPEPVIGQWYRNVEDGKIFEIVALDEDDSTIEIQYFESEIGEVDLDHWYEEPLVAIAEPEDCSGAYDEQVTDELGDAEGLRHNDNWSNSLDNLD